MELQFSVLFVAAFTFLKGLSADEHVVTYSSKEEERLECPKLDADVVQWATVEGGSLLCAYLKSTGNVSRETSDPKYTNFDCSLTSTNLDLTITNVDKDDGDAYRCTRISGGPITYTLEVEVVSNVEVSSNGTVFEEGETYTFTCTAEGVRSSNELQLVWSTDDTTDDSGTMRTINTEDNSLEDLTNIYTFRPKRSNSFIRCNITGYETQQQLSDMVITASLNLDVLYAPDCTLELKEVDVKDSCTVELTCTCDGKPEPMEEGYQYFRDNSLIDGRNTITETLELPLDPEKIIKFSCSGSNSVGEGERSSDTPYTCASPPTTSPPTPTVSTTVSKPLTEITSPMSTTPATTPTTPMKTMTSVHPTETSSLGIIITFSCIGGILVLVVIGGLVYWFCIRTPGNHTNGKSGNNTVTASSVETTNSAPPVYGVVNKSTKKKSDNTDGNGVNTKLAAEQPEYAAVNKPSQPQAAPRTSQAPDNKEQVELQYADLDHGKQGASKEVRKPVDEPTEYATVQSVIV